MKKVYDLVIKYYPEERALSINWEYKVLEEKEILKIMSTFNIEPFNELELTDLLF